MIDKSTNGRDRPLWGWPVLQGILPLDRSRISGDVIAGVTLAALGIPEVMGYTKIIGTPVVTGLYTLLLPVLAFALFGSSRHLVVSADSATAAIVAAALAEMAVPAYAPRYVALTGLVALAASAMLLAARLVRAGFLADFLSRTVLVGFLSGVGIQVAAGQLHAVLGLDKGGHGFFGELLFNLRHLPDAHWLDVLISVVVLGVSAGCDAFLPRFPGALLAVAGMIGASALLHLGDRGVQLVGEVPGGLPALALPGVSWTDLPRILPVSFSCVIVILAQSAATARAYALRYRERFDENVDLVGLALANAAAGCGGTFVVNGSPTKTAMVDDAGGRSQISHLTAAAVVLVVLLFLTKPLSYLPNSALAAIVLLIGIKLVDLRGLARIYRQKPMEFVVALATAVTVIVVGVEQGILLALVLSLLQHVRRSYQPSTGVILRDATDHWRMEPARPGWMLEPGLVLYWFGAELFYANAAHFVEQAHRLIDASPTPVRWLVVDAGAITAIDFTAGEALTDLREELAKQGVVLAMTRVSPGLRKDLDRLGLTTALGAGRIFDSRHDCLSAYEAFRSGAAAAGSARSGNPPPGNEPGQGPPL